MDDFSMLINWDLVPGRAYDAAFLCWLLDSINRPDEDLGIKKSASNLLDFILKDNKQEKYTTVDLVQDCKDISIIAVVNGSIAVIMETQQVQVKLLKNMAVLKQELYNGLCPSFTRPFTEVVSVMFDLRYRESGVGIGEVYDSADMVISAGDLLDCLERKPEPQAEIFQNYLSYLRGFYEKSRMFLKKDFSEWDRFCFYGFFTALEKEMPSYRTGWGTSQTVYGLQRWFCWDDAEKGYDLTAIDRNIARLYFQIEILEDRRELCIKCKAGTNKRIPTSVLWELCQVFSKSFEEEGYSCGKKRFLGGQITPVCAVPFELSQARQLIGDANKIYQSVVPDLILSRG